MLRCKGCGTFISPSNPSANTRQHVLPAVFGQRNAEDYAGVFARIPNETDYMLRYA